MKIKSTVAEKALLMIRAVLPQGFLFAETRESLTEISGVRQMTRLTGRTLIIRKSEPENLKLSDIPLSKDTLRHILRQLLTGEA